MSRLVVAVELNNLLKFTEEIHSVTKYNEDTGEPYTKEIEFTTCKLGNVTLNSCFDFEDFIYNWENEKFGDFSEFFKKNTGGYPEAFMCDDGEPIYYLAYEISDCLDDCYSMIEEIKYESITHFKEKLEKFFKTKFDLEVNANLYLTSA